jgi:hypothetical protein
MCLNVPSPVDEPIHPHQEDLEQVAATRLHLGSSYTRSPSAVSDQLLALEPEHVDATITALRKRLPGTLIGISTGAWIEREDDRPLVMIGRIIKDI